MAKYAMVIDLNTCVGCNACMAACTLENQMPVGQIEEDGEIKWDTTKWRTYVHDEEIGVGNDVHRRFFPRLCNHCDNPPCMSVCPTGATYKTDDGFVLVNEDLCMGCQACAMACPYKARVDITYADVRQGKEFYGSDYRRTRPSVDKCSFCNHRVEKGLKPACVETCVGESRMFGDLENPEDPVAQMVASGEAQPLMPHIGTRPNVYYINDMKRRG